MRNLIYFSVGLMFLLSGYYQATYAASLLRNADGSWHGDGWYRVDAQGVRKKTKCKLDLKYDRMRRTLLISGKCAGRGRRSDISGEIVHVATDNSYTGYWRSSPGIKTPAFIGKKSANQITLKWRAEQKGIELLYSAHWKISGANISLTFFGGADGKSQLSHIDLVRRD